MSKYCIYCSEKIIISKSQFRIIFDYCTEEKQYVCFACHCEFIADIEDFI
jgi:hypothetical protein